MIRSSLFASLVVLSMVAVIPQRALAQGTLYTLAQNGPQNLRVNIVILSEGYTAAQESQFVTDAGNMLNYLLATPPWSNYASYMNGYAIWIASNESGADDPSELEYRDTYFNSTFDSYGTDRLLTIPPNDLDPVYSHGYGKVYNLLSIHVPAYDVVLVLANDPQYGGSGGAIAVSSLNVSAPEIVVHEIGHSFAGLGDEYDDPYPGFPDIEEPNTTQQTVRELIKWNVWILPTTPIPTPETAPYSSVVGLFEGAHYHATGWYRPKRNCKMNTLGPPFCEVCRQTHVVANYALVAPIDSLSPPAAAVTVNGSEAETLRVVPKSPAGPPLRIRWYDDGVLLPNTTPQAIFSATDLGPGANLIECLVTDTTPLVRVDPYQLLQDLVQWTLSVGCYCPCLADPSCDSIVSDVVDVVATIGVAFRGASSASSGTCAFEDSDTDCSGSTDIVDVVKAINVAFRGADPLAEYCNYCP